VVTTFAKNGPRHLQEYAGVLGLLDTPLHPALLTGWAALAVGAALGDPAARLTALQRSLALSTGIAVVLTVCFVVYLVWMEPGAALVTIQGRHLIPAGPLFLAPLQGLLPLRRRGSAARALAVGIAAAAVILAATTYTVAGRFHRRDAATLQTFEALALTTAFRKTAQLDELNAVFEASGYSGAPALAYSAAVEADLEGRADAIGLYREALRLAPGALLAERPLAWLLATDARTGPDEAREAIAFARSAARASGADDPVALRILAAALARAGGYAAAARTAEVAATAARDLGRGDLERRILADRQQYLENQPLEAQESS
jgi:tetratricopeptide (TPR) repeat protein